jgi:hypothetical protein
MSPEAQRAPSGEIATADAPSLWPAKREISRPVATSQTRAVLSQLAEARRFPSAEKARALTVWPWRKAVEPRRAIAPLGERSSSARVAAARASIAMTTMIVSVLIREDVSFGGRMTVREFLASI